MKKRNLIIIAAVVVVGIVALVVALNGRRTSTFKQDYNIEDIDAVTRIYLADKQDNEVLLTRVGDSSWIVDNTYPANQPLVDMLLETLHTMQIRQQVNRNAVPNVIKDISARSVKVEVYGRADSGETPRIEHQRAAVPMDLRYSAPALARRR